MSTVTDLSVLRINYLTQQQYDDAVLQGLIDPDELYLTPAQGSGVTDVEVDGVSVVTGGVAEIDLTGKQDTLVSGTNIKTVNNQSLLGSGNIAISGGTQNVWYGTCSSGSNASPKVVTTTSGDFVLATGNTVFVKFSSGNTALTANVNVDSTGSKSICHTNGNTDINGRWYAGEVVGLVYDGTRFVMLEGGAADTIYYGVTKLSDSTSSTSTTLAATANAVKTAYDLADSKSIVSVTQTLSSGTEIGSVTVNGTATKLYAPSGGGSNVQADWTENDPTADSYIQNKPTTASITPVTKKTVVTGGTTTNIPNISSKTVVTGVTKATVVTGGSTTSITPVTKKTVVTSVTPATVVTGGSTTSITPVTSKTVVTSASGATASVSNGVLTLTDGSFGTGDSVTSGTAVNAYTSLTTGASASVSTGDSVTAGTAVNAYTSLTTGDSVTVTTGDSVTVGTPIAAYTSLTTGDSVTEGTAINVYKS